MALNAMSKPLEAKRLLKQEGNGPIDEHATIIPILTLDLKSAAPINYPGIYVHIAILEASETTMASK